MQSPQIHQNCDDRLDAPRKLTKPLESFTARKLLSIIQVAGRQVHLAINYRWTVVAISADASESQVALN
jgi:hypothetical protein